METHSELLYCYAVSGVPHDFLWLNIWTFDELLHPECTTHTFTWLFQQDAIVNKGDLELEEQ